VAEHWRGCTAGLGSFHPQTLETQLDTALGRLTLPGAGGDLLRSLPSSALLGFREGGRDCSGHLLECGRKEERALRGPLLWRKALIKAVFSVNWILFLF